VRNACTYCKGNQGAYPGRHEEAQTGYVVTARLSSITDKLEQQDKKQSGPSATGSVFTGVPIGLPVFTLLI